MCLLSVLPKGTIKTSTQVEDFVRAGVWGNADGSGVAIKKHNEKIIHFKKGFTTAEEIMNYIKEISPDIRDLVMIHHRIGTRGARSVYNVHPFVISENGADMCQTGGETKLPMMAHNGGFTGSLSYPEDSKKQYFSDTFYFAKNVLGTPELMTLLRTNPVKFRKVYDEYFGTYNKVAVMFPDRNYFEMLGDWKKCDGYFHSHGGFTFGRDRQYSMYGSEGDNYHEDFIGDDSREVEPVKVYPKPQKVIQSSSSTALSIVHKKDDVYFSDPLGTGGIIIDKLNWDKFVFIPKLQHKLPNSIIPLREHEICHYVPGLSEVLMVKRIGMQGEHIPVIESDWLIDCVISAKSNANDTAWKDYLTLYREFTPSRSGIKRMNHAITRSTDRPRVNIGRFRNLSRVAVMKYAYDNLIMFQDLTGYDLIKMTPEYIAKVSDLNVKLSTITERDDAEIIAESIVG